GPFAAFTRPTGAGPALPPLPPEGRSQGEGRTGPRPPAEAIPDLGPGPRNGGGASRRAPASSGGPRAWEGRDRRGRRPPRPDARPEAPAERLSRPFAAWPARRGARAVESAGAGPGSVMGAPRRPRPRGHLIEGGPPR